MIDIKKITQKILTKQGFQENEITNNLFNDLYETIQDYYITNIMSELKKEYKSSFIFMIQAQTPLTEIQNFLEKNIDNYNQFILDLTYQLEDQMGISGLLN